MFDDSLQKTRKLALPEASGSGCVRLWAFLVVMFGSGLSRADSPDFQSQVRPILSEYCFTCHGPDAQSREADLRLDRAADAARVLRIDASNSGEHLRGALTSELGKRILSKDPDEVMPPAGSKQPSAAERRVLKQWLEAGGEYAGHWSLSPLTRPAVPQFTSGSLAQWPVNAIDAFVLQELRAAGLQPAPPATPTTLLRRVTYSLTGLPPSPAQIEAFETAGADTAIWGSDPIATYLALIESSLRSPSYGEHMAATWLDAARYADTDGYQNDRYRYQHAWRDWVIRAYNQNMPYDQFLLEQLAGDMLPEASLWQQVATGFGRNHRINSEDGSIEAEWRIENVVDRVDTFGTVFLGLTVGCARCHDHKYDPISQQDYYQLFAYFNSIAEYGVGPNNGNTPPFVTLPPSWPLLSESEDQLVTPEPVELRSARKEAGNGLRRPQAGSPETVMVMHELDTPRDTYLLLRGQYDAPDTSVKLLPDIPEVFRAVDVMPPANRLELARWLCTERHPLTARVAVNRLWQQFFGVGLVESSENLGAQGGLPSNSALLDWLACEFEDSGWDVQHIQRLILQSATFQQSSIATAAALSLDPQNRLLSRGPRVRLTAAEIRDSALAAGGLLAHRIGGPSVKPYMPPKVWSSISNNKYEQDSGESLFRRSVYTYWRRTIPPPTMVNFNAATREVCSVRTPVTNTPLQALTMLNNKTFVEAARNLAQRLIKQPAADIHAQIAMGFQLVVSRKPSKLELEQLALAYQDAEALFSADLAAAQQLLSIGESPRCEDLPLAQHAAMSSVANIIMNLDEAIHRE